MSDLVERLREKSRMLLSCVAIPEDSRLVAEAAAEIARLRAANKALVEAADNLVMAVELPGDHCELQPAIERIRALARAVEGAKHE